MRNVLFLIFISVGTCVVFAQPAWDFNFRQYEYSMNISVVLEYNDTLFENSSNLIVAAFNKDGDVIGKAEPYYYESIGKYRIPLAVFGNVQNDSIFFQVYVPDLRATFYLRQSMVFNADQIIGHFEQPFVLNLNDGVVSTKTQRLNKFTLFPNPAFDIIHLKGNDDALHELVIYDIRGDVVLKRQARLSNLQIDISAFQSGTYFLQTEERTQLLKFVKR